MSLRALIVDDEPLARQRLQRLLRAEQGVDLLPPCADGAAAVAAVREHRPDVLFLDVQMPGLSGFDVLQAIDAEEMPVVIFVTAHDRFALQAFEAEALDYLLKPFGADRVHKALARARTLIGDVGRQSLAPRYRQAHQRVQETAGTPAEPCVLVRKRERIIVLRPGEIDVVEAYGDYVRLRAGGDLHVIRGTLADMERRLTPAGFVRIHRSRIVNWRRVREFVMDRDHDPHVVLEDGTRLVAGANHLRELRQRLADED